MQTVNLTASAVQGLEAFQVANAIRQQHFGGGKPPTKVTINLAPCAKQLFATPRDARRFESMVQSNVMQ